MKRKIVGDMALNLIAAAIPIAVLQLILLPMLSREMNGDEYGLVVTFLSIFGIIPDALGNVLNNIRLIYENRYCEKNFAGDFNIILFFMVIFDLIAIIILTIYYEGTINTISIIMMILASILRLLKEYYIVFFRIIINYKAIVINNILMALGYFVGYFLYYLTDYWQMIYVVAPAVSLVYIICHCDLWKEPFSLTPLFKTTSVQTILLFISVLLSRITTYADRLILYPLLGGTAVTVYFVATIFGKMISMIMGPVNSVVLTYLAKVKTKNSNIFKRAFMSGSIICVIGYIFCVILSKPILGFLYPQYISEGMKYIFITTGTAVVGAQIGLISPFIMKFFDMKWQIIINAGTSVIYIVICLILLKLFGLMGFCVGSLLTNFIKLGVMLLIYIKCKEIEFD